MGTDDKSGDSGNADGDSIRVIIRVRPSDNHEDGSHCIEVDDDQQTLRMLSKEAKLFTFDQICNANTTQETVFRSVGKKIIDSCITGYNGTIFAYGQTGSGKTFTMLGPSEDSDNFQHELRGVIPRSFEYLFSLIKTELDMHGDKVQFLCKCSFLEIYNESVFDLLDAASKGLHLRENIKKGVFVDGIIEQAVTNASEAYDVLAHGWTNRSVASTSMNRESSRSHAVFTLYVESKKLVNGVWNVRSSQLNLVDLAGSERQKDTNTVGARLKEAGNINKSLSALGNVIMALVDICHGKNRHVPYRDSKLTFLLRDSLGGNAKTSIIACVHPGSRCFGETLSTLHFARRAKMIKNKAVVNEDMQGSVTLLQGEIKRLKEHILDLLQKQGVPPQVGPGEPGGEVIAVDPSVDGKYKQLFLEAMMFKQKSDSDRKGWFDKYNKLQETCNAKERALRQNKMVLKFREEAIKKFEKVVKEKGGLMDNEDTTVIIESLKGELEALTTKFNNHPEVTRYRVEAENLREEVKRLKQQQTTLTLQKVKELEREFKTLQIESNKDGAEVVAPQSNDATVTNATLEKQKAQINKLQEELESERKIKADLIDNHEKARLTLEADIESLKATNEELKKLNASTRSRFQIEREARDDIHADTIKKMTTPTRRQSMLLRNRSLIMAGSAGSHHGTPTGTVSDSFSEEMGILDEHVPQELMEGQIEALKEENSRLNDEIRKLSEQITSQEDEKLGLVTEKTKIAYEKNQLEEILKKKQSSFDEEMKITKDLYNQLLEEHQTVKKDLEFQKSHAEDLEIMTVHAEKKNIEMLRELKHSIAEKDKEIGHLGTLNMQLEVSREQLEKDLNSAQDDVDRLKESEETLQATLEFTQSQMAQVEESLKLVKAETESLESESSTLRAKLEGEKEKAQNLKDQLAQQEGELQKALLSVQSELEMKEGELEADRASIKEMHDLMTGLQATIAEKDALLERQIKAHNELMEGLQSAQKQLCATKEEKEAAECLVEETNMRVVELQKRVDDLLVNLQAVESSNSLLKDEMEAIENSMQQKDMELENMSMDLDQYMEMNSSLEQQKHHLLNNVSKLMVKETSLTEELDKANKTVTKMEGDLSSLQEKNKGLEESNHQLEENIGKLQQSLATAEKDCQNLSEELNSTAQKAATYKIMLETIKSASAEAMNEKHELETKEKDDLINSLQENVAELRTDLAERHDEVITLNERLEKEHAQLTAMTANYDSVEKLYHATKDREEELKAQLSEKEKTIEKQVDSITDLKLQLSTFEVKLEIIPRLQNDVSKYQSRSEEYRLQKEQLASELKELKETFQINEQEISLWKKESTELVQDKERLLDLIRTKDAELEEEKSKISEWKERMRSLERQISEYLKKVEDLSNENARLVGHQNPKQKIQHHLKIKDENNSLREVSQSDNGVTEEFVKLCEAIKKQLALWSDLYCPPVSMSQTTVGVGEMTKVRLSTQNLNVFNDGFKVDYLSSSDIFSPLKSRSGVEAARINNQTYSLSESTPIKGKSKFNQSKETMRGAHSLNESSVLHYVDDSDLLHSHTVSELMYSESTCAVYPSVENVDVEDVNIGTHLQEREPTPLMEGILSFSQLLHMSGRESGRESQLGFYNDGRQSRMSRQSRQSKEQSVLFEVCERDNSNTSTAKSESMSVESECISNSYAHSNSIISEQQSRSFRSKSCDEKSETSMISSNCREGLSMSQSGSNSEIFVDTEHSTSSVMTTDLDSEMQMDTDDNNNIRSSSYSMVCSIEDDQTLNRTNTSQPSSEKLHGPKSAKLYCALHRHPEADVSQTSNLKEYTTCPKENCSASDAFGISGSTLGEASGYVTTDCSGRVETDLSSSVVDTPISGQVIASDTPIVRCEHQLPIGRNDKENVCCSPLCLAPMLISSISEIEDNSTKPEAATHDNPSKGLDFQRDTCNISCNIHQKNLYNTPQDKIIFNKTQRSSLEEKSVVSSDQSLLSAQSKTQAVSDTSSKSSLLLGRPLSETTSYHHSNESEPSMMTAPSYYANPFKHEFRKSMNTDFSIELLRKLEVRRHGLDGDEAEEAAVEVTECANTNRESIEAVQSCKVKDSNSEVYIVEYKVALTTPSEQCINPLAMYTRGSGGSSMFSTGGKSSESSGASSQHSMGSKSSASSSGSAITVLQMPTVIAIPESPELITMPTLEDMEQDAESPTDTVKEETSLNQNFNEPSAKSHAPSPIIAGCFGQQSTCRSYVPKAKRRILTDLPDSTWAASFDDESHYTLEGTRRGKPVACSSIVEVNLPSSTGGQGMHKNPSFVHQHYLKLKSPESNSKKEEKMKGLISMQPRSHMHYNVSVAEELLDNDQIMSVCGTTNSNTKSGNTAESSSATQLTNDSTIGNTCSAAICGPAKIKAFSRMPSRRRTLGAMEKKAANNLRRMQSTSTDCLSDGNFDEQDKNVGKVAKFFETVKRRFSSRSSGDFDTVEKVERKKRKHSSSNSKRLSN